MPHVKVLLVKVLHIKVLHVKVLHVKVLHVKVLHVIEGDFRDSILYRPSKEILGSPATPLD